MNLISSIPFNTVSSATVGLDFSGKYIDAFLSLPHGFEVHRRFNNDAGGTARVHNWVRSQWSESITYGYEASFVGYYPCRQLTALGANCIVLDPDVAKGRRGSNKSDKGDARRIAIRLRSGDFKSVAVPTVQEEQDRALVRTRFKARDQCNDALNRLSAVLRMNGLPPVRRCDQGEDRFLISQELLDSNNPVILSHLGALNDAASRLTDLTAQVLDLAKTDRHSHAVKALTALAGVGELGAITYDTELYQPERFKNSDAVAKFVGLTPNSRETAHVQHLGPITKTGPHTVRHMLTMSALAYSKAISPVLFRPDRPAWLNEIASDAWYNLSGKYQAMVARGKPRRLVQVAIARELAGYVWKTLIAVNNPEAVSGDLVA